jgi:hypothetical protein
MEALILQAIKERRLVEFRLHGLGRVAEIHLYGVHKGIPQLLVYQVAGDSRSGGLPHWRRVDLGEMSDLVLLPRAFTASRLSSRPGGWDQVLLMVE